MGCTGGNSVPTNETVRIEKLENKETKKEVDNNKKDEELKKAEEENKKAEELKKSEEEKKRAEEERKRAEELKRAEEEKQKAEDERKRAEELKRAEEEKKRVEEERRRVEELKKAEEEKKKAEEEKQKAEEERKREEELKKLEEEKQKAEEENQQIKEENQIETELTENDLTKDDNLELVGFSQDNMNLEKLRELELKEHNYLRSLHGVPPLTINERLNDIAQKYAQVLAKKQKMEHSKKEDRALDGKYVGENLYTQSSTAKLVYTCGSMSKSWYSEIKDYNFETGQSTGVTGHFTQLIWKDSKEVGFGIAFGGKRLFTVANYFPGGNFNMDTTFAEQLLKPLPSSEKSCKDIFNLENAKNRELKMINIIRQKNNVGDLELDENLCKHALKFAENTAKTGSKGTAKEINGKKHSVNVIELYLRRGALYKGGEGMKKIYNESIKNKADKFTQIMVKAMTKASYKKVGFGYYFKDENDLLVFAVYDGF